MSQNTDGKREYTTRKLMEIPSIVEGPFKVEERIGDSTYKIKGLRSKKYQVVHFDRLKPCLPNVRNEDRDDTRNTAVQLADAPLEKCREDIQLARGKCTPSRGSPTNARTWCGSSGMRTYPFGDASATDVRTWWGGS